ncbi:retinoid-inducible serine carboxypeptidase [Astyanax mexicanus]|uniref:Carboxypeptidase n=2 Tax=Astyanax mexicanus TaxID=7994 RepID=A0A8B9HI39_ASTMX|nr:retinoid-inducible serine carboxypeptidase [Astyanax mexicanus]KAG9263995.1 retinoid-inducible serine carboxypeptidase [Astyanax mexicanus]
MAPGRTGSWAAVLLFAVSVCRGWSLPVQEKEVWGYVDVREGAHMFWWLYYANSPSFKDLPLVMWLQGGPGGSSCGFGNFGEIGPLDTDLKPRKTSWVNAASVLFVDNPVGTGYSYTDSEKALATDVSMVAADMMVLLQSFFSQRTEFQTVPFYIFSESYGGKMASAISLELTKAVQKGSIKCNFAGVALGDSWISPLDSVLTWGPYLYSTSLLDDYGLKEVTQAAKDVQQAVQQGQYQKATQLWSVTENVVEQNTNGVNFYNILTQQDDDDLVKFSADDQDYLIALKRRHIKPLHGQSLSELMNGPIRKKLGVIPKNVTWGGQAEDVFSSMSGDFMKPVVDIVDELLSAGVNVTVYNGQLDLIVDTMGQELWVKKLKWEGLQKFNQMKWTALEDPESAGQTGAFYKTYKNFAFYWILKAGHMIPSDQGEMALRMLKMVTLQE